MRVPALAIVALAATSAAALAGGSNPLVKAYWERMPEAAFVEAYVYACQPVEYDFAGAREQLDAAAREVHDDLLVRQYGGSCRDFYFSQVVPRLAGELQPFFVPVNR